MKEKTKIQFSEEELELMLNADWILTKNRIIEKISTGFETLAIRTRAEVIDFYPAIAEEVCSLGFKVSKGEKYQGLPYLMLDFPRIFSKDDVLAIRVFFWWGKFFSVTLHTKGAYTNRIARVLLSGKAVLDEEVFISHSGDEWNHDLGHHDYMKLEGTDKQALTASLKQNGFMKLSKRFNLMQWHLAEEMLHTQMHQYLNLLNLSFPGDEKDL